LSSKFFYAKKKQYIWATCIPRNLEKPEQRSPNILKAGQLFENCEIFDVVPMENDELYPLRLLSHEKKWSLGKKKLKKKIKA
jgi:hypothetical protein